MRGWAAVPRALLRAPNIAPLLALLLALLLAGCAGTVTTTPGGVTIDTRYRSQGQDSRVLFLILHYTAGSLPVSTISP